MVKAGHRVLATSRTPYDDLAKSIGVDFYQDVNDFCEEHPEVSARLEERDLISHRELVDPGCAASRRW